MELAFTKMHGIGNDVVVIDARQQDIMLTAAEARLIADRHFGIGWQSDHGYHTCR